MFLLTSMLDEASENKEVNEENINVVNVLDNTIKDKLICEEIVTNFINKKNSPNNSIIDENAYDDLEIFKGIDEDNNSIFNSIDRTKTISGKILFRNILNSPTTNITTLKTHQKILKSLIKNKPLCNQIEEKLKEIVELEKNILWILRDKTPEEQKILDSVFFSNKYLLFLNTQEQILTAYSVFKIIFSPVYGVLSPLLFLILPYLYLHFFTKVKFDFKTYFKIFKMSFFGNFNIPGMGGNSNNGVTRYMSMLISFVIYVQNLLNSIQVAKDNNTIINILHSKINNTNKLIKLVCELKMLTKDIHKFEDIKHCLPKIDNELFITEPNLFSNKGKILTCYNSIKNKDNYIDLINDIAVIDYYNSIVNVINENKDNICFPNYLENEFPIINAKQIWHPYLTKAVCNDILIGKKNPKNMLITGPNAGGKSTFIKSLAISVVFSQTVGIAFSQSFEVTPFSLINTYLNIPDCKGKESLFEAEMHRARDHIRKLEDTRKDELSFIVMDEIFNSTNPEEGISGAYAIAEKLASFNNSISVITTHFSYLTKLEKDDKFKNYKIPITRDHDDNIIYPYKLKYGISNQYIALELLRNKGFNNDLVDNAENICKTLSLNNVENINQLKEEPKKVETETVETNDENIDLNTLTEPEDNNSEIEFLEDTDTE